MRIINRPVTYNLLGAIFDKGLPMIVSALLTKFMSPNDYGRWSLFYAFLLISFTITSSPMLTIFARKFYTYKEDDQKMYIYFYKMLLVIQMLAFTIYYVSFASVGILSIFEILTLIFVNLYAYTALFFRYKGLEKSYMYQSLIRLAIFALVLLLSVLLLKKITYWVLIMAFMVCHLPNFIMSIKYLAFPKSKDVKDDLNEFAHLSIYGFSTSMINGGDKLIISGLGFSLSFLGYYSFIYALTNVPTVIIEAFKQTMVPTMFKEWTKKGQLSKETLKKIFLIGIALLLVQFLLPQVIYQVLVHLKMINKAFVTPQSVYYIFLLSIGCYIFSLYHFINPIYFFNKKSLYLLIIQIVCFLAYFIAVKVFGYRLDYKIFIILNTILLSCTTIFTFLLRFVLIKNNTSESEYYVPQ